jgi:hypothetical protein
MLFKDLWSNLLFDFWFHDVVDRQAQGNTSQRANPAGVSMSYSFSVELRAIGIGRTQNHDNTIFAITINELPDTFLTFQVKSTGGSSDKTLRQNKHWFCPGAFNTSRDSRTLNAITLTYDNNLFTF